MSAVSPANADLREQTAGRSLSKRARAALTPDFAAFAALLVSGFVIVLVETRDLSPYGDDWDFLVNRRGMSLHILLTPHGPHLSLLPILIYKVWLHVFGASSYLPWRVMAGLDMVLLASVLGWIGRRYWGKWWGLVPVVLMVTLGPAGASTLWSFQIGYTLAIAAGLTAVLLAASSESRRCDMASCALLIIALCSSSQGVGFTVGLALVFLLRRVGLRRWWVVLVPALLYLLWYAKYGHAASETELSLWPSAWTYMAQSVASTLPTFLGLSQITGGALDMTFGVPLAVAAVAGGGFALWRGWRPPALLWGLLISAAVLWIAAALSNFGPYERPANSPRYLETNAMILLAMLTIAVPRPRIPKNGAIAAIVILAVICLTNSNQYSVARAEFYSSDVDSRAELGALHIMEGVAPPNFTPAFPGDPGVLVYVTEQDFTSVNSAYGLEYDSVAELKRAPASVQALVDKDLGLGELSLSATTSRTGPFAAAPTILSGSAVKSGGCLLIGASAIELQLDPGQYHLVAGANFSATVDAGRFDPTPSVAIGTVPAGTAATLVIPSDRAPSVPWRVAFTGTGSRVCRLRS